MRAISLVMMLGIVAIGAGVLLAVTTTPAFSPYSDRGSERRTPLVSIAGPYGDPRDTPAYVSAAPDPITEDDGFRIRPGFQEGTVVLQVPRWADETRGWMERGRSAWHYWQGLIETDGDARRNRTDAGDYPYGRQDREYAPYGYRESDRDDDFESDRYAGSEYWADHPEAADDTAPQRYADAPAATRRAAEPTPDDAAARAARLAQDAARDVRAAEAL